MHDIPCLDGPLKGRRIRSPAKATKMAMRQAVEFLGGGRSRTVGPLLYRWTPDGWVQAPWTPADRLAVPETYELHFFGA